MKKWEYKTVIYRDDDPIPDELNLNTLGRQGWELCVLNRAVDKKGSWSQIAFFKRELEPPAKVTA